MNALIRPWENTWTATEEIGRGGQGIITEVRSNGDSTRRAVLKQIVERWRRDEQAQNRLRNEGEVLAILNQRKARVPRLLDSFSNHEQSEPFLLMEFIEGIRFDRWIKANGPVDPPKAAMITRAVAETIAICHEQKIGHRDIKPANIIFKDKDIASPYILDFGISFDSRQSVILTREGEMFWNEFIILPECQDLQGGHRDFRTDITALVGLFFTCLTGHPPGVPQDAEGRPPQRRLETLVRGSTSSTEEGERLMWFFDKGLSFRIADRFQSMQQFDENLAQFANAESNYSFDLFKQYDILDQAIQEKDRGAQLGQLKQVYKPIETYITTAVTNSLTPLKAKGAEVAARQTHLINLPPHNHPAITGADPLYSELLPLIQITRKHFSKTASVTYAAFGVGMEIHLLAASFSAQADNPTMIAQQLEWTKIAVITDWSPNISDSTKAVIVEALSTKLAYELRKLTPS